MKKNRKYLIIGLFTFVIAVGIYNVIDLILYSAINMPMRSFIGNMASAFVTAIWVIFIIDLKKKKQKQGETHAGYA